MGNNDLQPFPGYALVRLPKKYESGLSVEKEKYSTNSSGTLVDMQLADDSPLFAYDIQNWFNRTIYFTPFEDGDVIKHDGIEYVFVPTGQIRGVKNNA